MRSFMSGVVVGVIGLIISFFLHNSDKIKASSFGVVVDRY